MEKKCNFLFENLIFDIPQILKKHYFDTVALFVFLKMPKNTIKMGSSEKLGPLFNFKLGPLFNFTAYIYICARVLPH